MAEPRRLTEVEEGRLNKAMELIEGREAAFLRKLFERYGPRSGRFVPAAVAARRVNSYARGGDSISADRMMSFEGSFGAPRTTSFTFTCAEGEQ